MSLPRTLFLIPGLEEITSLYKNQTKAVNMKNNIYILLMWRGNNFSNLKLDVDHLHMNTKIDGENVERIVGVGRCKKVRGKPTHKIINCNHSYDYKNLQIKTYIIKLTFSWIMGGSCQNLYDAHFQKARSIISTIGRGIRSTTAIQLVYIRVWSYRMMLLGCSLLLPRRREKHCATFHLLIFYQYLRWSHFSAVQPAGQSRWHLPVTVSHVIPVLQEHLLTHDGPHVPFWHGSLHCVPCSPALHRHSPVVALQPIE